MYILLHKTGKRIKVTGKEMNTEFGKVNLENVKPGELVRSHKGEEFLFLEASIGDEIELMKKGARPIYHYDAGFFAALLNIKPGAFVLEAGTGSGCFTKYIASLGAKVITYEKRKEFYEIAKGNLKGCENIEVRYGDIREVEESGFDVIFLDLKYPEKIIPKIKERLKLGGFLGIYLPTMNRIREIVDSMKGFVNIRIIQMDTKEIDSHSLRIKGNVSFPGFFIFGRKFE